MKLKALLEGPVRPLGAVKLASEVREVSSAMSISMSKSSIEKGAPAGNRLELAATFCSVNGETLLWYCKLDEATFEERVWPTDRGDLTLAEGGKAEAI